MSPQSGPVGQGMVAQVSVTGSPAGHGTTPPAAVLGAAVRTAAATGRDVLAVLDTAPDCATPSAAVPQTSSAAVNAPTRCRQRSRRTRTVIGPLPRSCGPVVGGTSVQ